MEAIVRAANVGGETQDGGPKLLEYPGWILMSIVLLALGVVVWLAIGESYLLENVSAVTFFLPGTWRTLNLNIMALSLKFSSRGL